MIIKTFSQAPYEEIWHKMRALTDARTAASPDELWIVEHLPVYTLGQNGKVEHILNPGKIPVVKSDRGGQVTYHGPGQLVVYVLIDMRRLQLGVRQLVTRLENSVIQLLKSYGIVANARCDAPGVYVDDAKICSIGLRIRRHCTYHGLALNVAMDLSPFLNINPCGYEHLIMTQLKDLGIDVTPASIAPRLIAYLQQELGYTEKLLSSQ